MIQTKNVFLLFLLFICSGASGQIIITYAGVDTLGYSGDGGPATAAKFFDPERVRTDGLGNLYIADFGNSRIRMVNSAGIITTIAGNGSVTHSGDGGPAVDAGITFPYSVALDGLGNYYIAENNSFSGQGDGGSWIRKVDASGIITTIAGNGTSGYSGDGGPAIDAGFQNITDIAADKYGNIYVVEDLSSRVRKIDASGIINTIAGNGGFGYSGDSSQATLAQLNFPVGVAVDDNANVYIADALNSCVRIVNDTGMISTFAGNATTGYSGDGGQAAWARLAAPYGVTLDRLGNVYIVDDANRCVRKVDTARIITTIAGGNAIPGYGGDGGPAISADLAGPVGVAVDSVGDVFIADAGNQDIRMVFPPSNGVPALATAKEKELQIWPEPNDGAFTVNIPSATSEPARIIITNIVGQEIKEITDTTNKDIEVRIDVPKGMYFVTIVTGQGSQSAKVVVQ